MTPCRRIVRLVALLALTVSLAACKVALYSDLTEDESNEMVALLLSHKIDASKGTATKTGVPLMVESADLANAIDILHENGYPRDTFNNLGKVFAQQGLISSPLEERVRYIYGLSQSIAETLSKIDGVVTARVHIMVPEQHPLENKPAGSSASVFLKTRPDVNLEPKIPEIKMLVQRSVEGLDYDNVSVALFEVRPPRQVDIEGPPMESVLGLRITKDSSEGLMMIGGGVAAFLLLLLVGNIFLFLRLRRARTAAAAVSDV